MTAPKSAAQSPAIGPERFVVGASESTEAEYGFRADAPFSVLSMCDGDVYAVEGFATLEAARAMLKAEDVPASQIEIL